MLTGKQAFEGGETVSDAIATILKGEVDWTALPADTPRHIQSILRRCLQKDPQKRLPHIGVVRLELDEPPTETVANATPSVAAATAPSVALWKRALPAMTGALALGAIAGAWWQHQPATSPPVARFSIALPDVIGRRANSQQFMAISPDGTRIAFEDNTRVYVRLLSDVEARPIPGTEDSRAVGYSNPVFSPDGQSIAYASGTERALKRIAVAGGAAITICPIETPPFGVSWDRRGILFEQAGKGIFQVSPNAGTPELIIPMKSGELMHGPQRLPDEQTILYTYAAGNSGNASAAWDNAQIVAHSLKTGERKTLVRGGMERGTLQAATSSTPFAACYSPCPSIFVVSK
jgi:serine/threonine-protein kinase